MPQKMSTNSVIVALGLLYNKKKNFRVLFRKKEDGTLRYMLVSRITSIDFVKDYVTVYSEDKGDLRRFRIGSVITIEMNMEKPQMTPEQIAEYDHI